MQNNNPQPNSAAGFILIANDNLATPPFTQTLIYLGEHDSEGAMGFILNRPTKQTLSDLVPNGPPGLENIPVYYGGPVQPDSLMVARFEQTGPEPYMIQLHCEKNLENLHTLFRQKNTWLRAFIGYTGWSAGQLESELAMDSWTAAIPHTALFNENYNTGIWNAYHNGDTRWQNILTHLPKDASQN